MRPQCPTTESGGRLLWSGTRSTQQRESGGRLLWSGTRSTQQRESGGRLLWSGTRSTQQRESGGRLLWSGTRSTQQRESGGRLSYFGTHLGAAKLPPLPLHNNDIFTRPVIIIIIVGSQGILSQMSPRRVYLC